MSDEALCLAHVPGHYILSVDARELAELRREYAAGGLDTPDLEPDPIGMFRRWLHDAVRAGLYEPNAVVLATASPDGAPSARTVLLKGLDERGFVFYTNYASRKARELATDPQCALLFPWHPLERQVRVEGTAERLSDEENDAYFATRPRASQIGAWASPQSEVVPDRATLDRRYDEVRRRFADADVPRPEGWGGFRVRPVSVEFWQGRLSRMHDRMRYRLGASGDGAAGWVTERLAP